MKKFFASMLLLVLIVGLAACGAKAPATSQPPANPVDEMALSELMDGMLEGVKDLPETINITLDAENFAAYAFTDYKEGYEGLANEGMMNLTTHSVVLIRVTDDADAAAVAEEVYAKADLQKWICVGAEEKIVRQYGNTIVLIMSYDEFAGEVAAYFDALNQQ